MKKHNLTKIVVGVLALTISAGLSVGGVSYAKKLTVVTYKGTGGDHQRIIAQEYEKQTGVEIEFIEFPWGSLYEKEMLDLTTGAGAYDKVIPSSGSVLLADDLTATTNVAWEMLLEAPTSFSYGNEQTTHVTVTATAVP